MGEQHNKILQASHSAIVYFCSPSKILSTQEANKNKSQNRNILDRDRQRAIFHLYTDHEILDFRIPGEGDVISKQPDEIRNSLSIFNRIWHLLAGILRTITIKTVESL